MGEPVAWLVRWVGFVALAGLVGAIAVDCLVLPARAPELGATRDRLRALRVGGALVLLLASGGELLLRTATMSGAPLGAAMSALPPVLSRTHFGAIWSARVVLLILLVLTALRSRAALVLAVPLALGVAVTVTLTGHAADWGDVSVTGALDWIHVVAATAWAGGLFALVLLVLRAAPRWPPALLPAVMRRFSTLAASCLALVVLSGVYRAWIELPTVAALWQTTYGRILAVKVGLALGLVGCGAVNRYVVLPRLGVGRATGLATRLLRLGRLALMGPRRGARATPAARLAAWALREVALALAIFWCTAMLVESTPARHAGHAAHAAASEGPRRVTMADLHAAGGVPPGWLFSPPPGDAGRGRLIFTRLGCPACHRVGGDSPGAPTGVGPDLTDAGEHHPAGYLLESVINPNAVIVEGPGYTGADGRSIMPSYADRLTVPELLDLVAYLRTL